MAKSYFLSGGAVAVAAVMSIYEADGNLDRFSKGQFLDTPAKHVIASSIVGAADGLSGYQIIDSDLKERIQSIERDMDPDIRTSLLQVEEEGRQQAIRGEWTQEALNGYVTFLEMDTKDLQESIGTDPDFETFSSYVSLTQSEAVTPDILQFAHGASLEIQGMDAAFVDILTKNPTIEPGQYEGYITTMAYQFGILDAGPHQIDMALYAEATEVTVADHMIDAIDPEAIADAEFYSDLPPADDPFADVIFMDVLEKPLDEEPGVDL